MRDLCKRFEPQGVQEQLEEYEEEFATMDSTFTLLQLQRMEFERESPSAQKKEHKVAHQCILQ